MEWMRDAGCRDLDPRLFDRPTVEAKPVCTTCPVQMECRRNRMHPLQHAAGQARWPVPPASLPVAEGPVTTKWCPACVSSLPLSAFTSDRSRPDGLGAYCAECKRSRQRAYQALKRQRGRAARAGAA